MQNEKKLDITMISSLPPVKGISSYTKGLVISLSDYVNIDFLGFNKIYPKFLYPGEIYDNSNPIKENKNLKIRNVLNWYNPFSWVYQAFKIKTNIVHAQWWSPALAFVYFVILGICRLRGKRIIMTIHNVSSHEKTFLKRLLTELPVFLANEYIVHTLKNKKSLEKKVKGKKIHIIPHGIISSPIKGIDKKSARKELGLSQEDKILLCFGNIRDYKGVDVAIKALSLIKDENFKLLIAGQCWGDWEKYQNLINSNNLSHRIIKKIGFVPDDQVETIFRASDLILLPYKDFDAQSGVGALVLPFEIPMIVSDTGGLSEYVNEEEDLIFRQGDYKELSEKIKNLLKDDKLYNKSKTTIIKMHKELQWESIAKLTINEVYEE